MTEEELIEALHRAIESLEAGKMGWCVLITHPKSGVGKIRVCCERGFERDMLKIAPEALTSILGDLPLARSQ